MSAYHIHIEGQVQGVGFRPWVWRMARTHRVTGAVSNGRDGVHIDVSGTDQQCHDFYDAIVQNAPPGASITGHTITAIPEKTWEGFVIQESIANGQPDLLVTPDLALCPSCKAEMLDPANSRYHYPFITCTQCGPRYSIQREVPFDRAHTAMNKFAMCAACLKEYAAADDRRFYAQTNSCPHCGIALSLKGPDGRDIANDPAVIVALAGDLLKRGSIIALKNLGGYLLLCDATQPQAIQRLRERKRRPAKPFAVLYPGLESLQADADVSPHEANALLSAAAPVVIVKANAHTRIAKAAVAPGHADIGAMLPYTPLMAMLMEQVGTPLVATSGNANGSPIFYQNDDAFHGLKEIADYFMEHNRDIITPQDDSVVRFAGDQRIILRRARGFAPTYFSSSAWPHHCPALAMGSDLKSTLAFTNTKNRYVSQYLGDLAHYDVQQRYDDTLQHLTQLFDIKPQVVLADNHPLYFSSRLGETVAAKLKAPIKRIPHHEAHFCAVLAENDLLDSAQPVLGVIWDGTGWGADGHVWGGEFFSFTRGSIQRVTSLDYFDHLLGDKFSREPRLCALALTKHTPAAQAWLRPKFTDTEWPLYNKMLFASSGLMATSVGRLFDGVASLLGLCDRSTYEGEAAQQLEQLAATGNINRCAVSQRVAQRGFSLKVLIEEITAALVAGERPADIALHFHLALVQWIAAVAHRQNATQLAFSGGVFQNALLVRLIRQNLAHGYRLFFHQQLSPNDECLSMGQLAWYSLRQRHETGERSEPAYLTLT